MQRLHAAVRAQFVGQSPIGSHAYKNKRDFLDYEFGGDNVIQWGESAYAEERYVCTQAPFAQLSVEPASRLPQPAIGWCSTAAKELAGAVHCLTPT